MYRHANTHANTAHIQSFLIKETLNFQSLPQIHYCLVRLSCCIGKNQNKKLKTLLYWPEIHTGGACKLYSGQRGLAYWVNGMSIKLSCNF